MLSAEYLFYRFLPSTIRIDCPYLPYTLTSSDNIYRQYVVLRFVTAVNECIRMGSWRCTFYVRFVSNTPNDDMACVVPMLWYTTNTVVSILLVALEAR